MSARELSSSDAATPTSASSDGRKEPSWSQKDVPLRPLDQDGKEMDNDSLANVADLDRIRRDRTTRRPDGKIVLTEDSAYHVLGFSYPRWKKWAIITCVFIVQLSMNFNAAIYGNVAENLMHRFGISLFQAKVGQCLFLVMYAIGCEAWAPWSEELGRFWVLQGSLGLVNLWQIGCALAPNFGAILAFRSLGGLSSAGGSVTLGMVADMWEPNDQHYAISYVVFSSCAGSVIAPIFGGFIEQYLAWQWIFWISLIFGGVAQFIHAWVPETRASVLLDRHAKKLRRENPDCNIWGPDEVRGTFWQRTSWREIVTLMWRPYRFLLTEPIVAFLSLLSGFSDALIFTGLDSFGMVLSKYNFTKAQIGLSFTPLLIGYVISTGTFLPFYRHDAKVRKSHPDIPDFYPPERRLRWLLVLVLLEPIGLLGFSFGSLGPDYVPWIVPLLFTALIGIANLAIYQATIDYMVAAYGPYSASATGGNGFARDFLAGIAALYAHPFYTNIATGTKWQLPSASLIRSGIAGLVAIPVYIFYFHGEYFRTKSPFAQGLAKERATNRHHREEAIADSKNNTPTNSRPTTRPTSPTRLEDGDYV